VFDSVSQRFLSVVESEDDWDTAQLLNKCGDPRRI
jgi:hypothetical protein